MIVAGAILFRHEPPPMPSAVVTGRSARVTAEVLNATRRSRLARAGTAQLRRDGIDVVFFGTADTLLDSTLILIRRGNEEVGSRVARSLGAGRVVMRIDTLRRLDVTVLLGEDFHPIPGLVPGGGG